MQVEADAADTLAEESKKYVDEVAEVGRQQVAALAATNRDLLSQLEAVSCGHSGRLGFQSRDSRQTCPTEARAPLKASIARHNWQAVLDLY